MGSAKRDYRDTPFGDPSLDIEKRLDWLIDQLSLEEKFTLLSSGSADIDRLSIKAMGFGGEAAHGLEARNDQNGLKKPDITTSFPQPIGMSASWDTEAIHDAGEVVGKEARVVYHRHPQGGLSRWAPTVDLERSPRWGRNEEGYGEDPVLTGEMASAYIRGMQGEHPEYIRVAATLKHFYANNVEFGRGRKNSSVDPRNKYEYYLEPFRRAIEDGKAEGVMSAYNRINGTQGLFNSEINTILKDQYGLTHAVSDGGAMGLVVSYSHDNGLDAETIARSVKAGVDAMSDDPSQVEAAAREAYELGLMSEEDMDQAIRNTFRTRLKLGIYDRDNLNPFDKVTEDDILSEENERICHKLSQKSLVLLKNDGILPLSKEALADAALIGPVADEWYQDWYGGIAPYRSTVKDGLGTEDDHFCDARDIVILRCGDKYLSIDDGDSRLVLSDEAEQFVMDDWGENAYSFRSIRTGKYISTHISDDQDAFSAGISGEVYADSSQIFSWFVLETVHMDKCDDGSVILQSRFGDPFCTDDYGRICSKENPKSAGKGGSTILMGADPGISEKSKAVTANNHHTGEKILNDDGDSCDRKDGLTISSPLHIRIETVRNGIDEARRLAAGSEKVILTLGHNPMVNAKEETDRASIEFIPYQQRLFDEIYKVNPNIIVVLLSDYPFAINDINKKARAVLLSATGSQCMGTVIAETLAGENAPSGRLPQTWYKEDIDLGRMIDDYDIINNPRTYRYYDKEVLYPFGYGLTYTSFKYSDLAVSLYDCSRLDVTLNVTNVGPVRSDEVVQIYASAPASRVKKPLRQLIAFERIKDIEPGETVAVEFNISTDELRFYDVTRERLIVEEGTYRIFAGPDSATEAVDAEVYVPGSLPGVRDLSKKIKADHYDLQSGAQIVEGCFGFKALMSAATMSAYDPAIVKNEEKPEKEMISGYGYTAEYGACRIPMNAGQFRIHAFASGEASLKVYADDVEICSFSGDTRNYETRPIRFRDWLPRAVADAEDLRESWPVIWSDIRMDVDGDKIPSEPCRIRIAAEGPVKFDWFEFI